jgi:hypothetical protein
MIGPSEPIPMVFESLPPEFRTELARFPPGLQALVEAELAAGNTLIEVGGGFPAPPVGACAKFARPMTTRPDVPGIHEDRWPNWSWPRGFRDEGGRFFVVEPPAPAPVAVAMDELRTARAQEPAATAPPSTPSRDASPRARFERSLVIDREQWHDGIGYDLEALRAAGPEDRAAIESLLLQRGIHGWRDVEALAEFDSQTARAALRRAAHSIDDEIRMAVLRHAPDLVSDDERTNSLVRALESVTIFGGLDATLTQIEAHHPRPVLDALFRATLTRPGDVACNLAGMLWHLSGRSDEIFDWQARPRFLRFVTEDRAERVAAFRALCAELGVDPIPYLGSSG